ncbi:Gfo/Idh/MocA family oxidoreductase [Microbacterium profundi]|uniref:Gfo/Idh/MocA family oxidoreductase n=1 Tax=Microbacterium profundi TaxID=450380 RepID=UPI001F26A01A|nr:Gfo/Idh/MocA family oxidoreductase [Microbacterium profundi]MCE7481216.1 Gfo/Idh/MocA family oxidoreductase [Microbacterium profundi]
MQRFALIGAGFIGAVHATNLAANPDIAFTLVYDVDPVRAADVARAHGAEPAASLAEAFDPARVDAVLIASSTPTHAEHLRSAADAGIAAFVEKPVDLDLATVRETVAYVERSGIPAMVDFNRRFDRDHAELRRIVRSGGVGAVELMQLTSRGPSSPALEYVAVSGGQMRDQTVHFFDLARWISGEDPVEIFVTGSALADPRITEYHDVDTSVATLRLAGGGLIQIDSVRRTGYGYDERIEVMGASGLVESGRHREGNVLHYGSAAIESDGLHAGWFERVRPTYAASLDAFVASLETGAPVPVTLQDGLKAQVIAEAASASLRSGRPERIEYVEAR